MMMLLVKMMMMSMKMMMMMMLVKMMMEMLVKMMTMPTCMLSISSTTLEKAVPIIVISLIRGTCDDHHQIIMYSSY